MSTTKNALISVFDKRNLDKLVPYLEQQNFHIYTTGGTLTKVLEYVENKDIVYSISDYTGHQEICDGRVKTLHPRIYGGILGLRNNPEHLFELQTLNIKLFDLIVVNLYPFEKVLAENPEEEELLENIDIGGHTLLRAAAKNYKYVSVLSDPEQYNNFINNEISNKELAKKAMQRIMKYDIAINNWFNKDDNEVIGHSYKKQIDLKYGLNPYMKPSYICTKDNASVPFEILNGKPGYINLLDIHYAIHLVLEVKKQLDMECCASFKHNSPAGVSMFNKDSDFIDYSVANHCLLNTRDIDPKSSFGDVVGYSGMVDKEMAETLKTYISDGIIAADYTEEALDILKTKKKGDFLIMKQSELKSEMQYRDINGITLVQPTNDSFLDDPVFNNIEPHIKSSMILGYITLKYTQSNCVCFVYKNKVIGIGAGQQNRVDCIRIAGDKAKYWMERHQNLNWEDPELVMISDAFLPFVDNIEVATKYNIAYILQPGGSIRDKEIIESCIDHDIKMVMSDKRVFTH